MKYKKNKKEQKLTQHSKFKKISKKNKNNTQKDVNKVKELVDSVQSSSSTSKSTLITVITPPIATHSTGRKKQKHHKKTGTSVKPAQASNLAVAQRLSQNTLVSSNLEAVGKKQDSSSHVTLNHSVIKPSSIDGTNSNRQVNKKKRAKKRSKPVDTDAGGHSINKALAIREFGADFVCEKKRARVDSSVICEYSKETKMSKSRRKRLRKKKRQSLGSTPVMFAKPNPQVQSSISDNAPEKLENGVKSILSSKEIDLNFQKKISKRQKKRNRNNSGEKKEEKTSSNIQKTNILLPPIVKSSVLNSEKKLQRKKNSKSNVRNETSSDSEPELIQASWKLAEESSVDLDESEEDVDESEEELSNSTETGDEESEEDFEESDDADEDNENREKNVAKPVSSNLPRSIESSKIANSKESMVEEKNNIVKLGNTPDEKRKSFSVSDKESILKEVKSRSKELSARSVYLSPVPPNCSFEMLKKLSPPMVCCRLPINPKSKKLRRYAFLEYSDPGVATKEQLNLSGRLFCGATVRAEIMNTTRTNSLNTEDDVSQATVSSLDFSRLFVCGLVPAVNTVDLRTIFPSASSISLATSAENAMLGFATLTFLSAEAAIDVFSQSHGFVLRGHPISLNFPFKREPIKQRTSEKIPTSALVRPPNDLLPNLNSTKKDEVKLSHVLSNSAKSKVLVQTISSCDEDDCTSLTADLLNVVNSKPTQSVNKIIDNTKSTLFGEAPRDGTLISKIFKQNSSKIPKDDSDSDSFSSESDEVIGENDDENRVEEADTDDVDDVDEIDASEDAESDLEEGDDDTDESAEEEVDTSDEVMLEEDVAPVGLSESELSAENGISSEEEIDSLLSNALNARKACAKSRKAPGAKHNWKMLGNENENSKKFKKKPSGSMPIILPIPKVHRS